MAKWNISSNIHSYDRFVRLAVLKALNNNGRSFPDDKIIPYGLGIMNSVYEPHSQRIYHYVHMNSDDSLSGQGDGYTQYIIVYDLHNMKLYIRPYDSINWTTLCLSDCSRNQVQHHILNYK